jgi:hypothetical protein
MSRASRFSLGLACSALLFVLVLPVSLSAQTTLRWKFQKGQQLSQVIEQTMNMNAKAGDLDIETKMNQTIDAKWNVTAVNDQGIATIEQDFTRIRMKMDALGNGFEFDSDDPKELTGIGALVGPALKALASTQFTLTMSPAGKIDKVEVSDDAVKALKSIPGAGQLGAMFSKEGLVKMIKQGSHHFPDGALEKGDSWTIKSENELTQVGKMVVNSKLTYAGPEQVGGKQLERIDLEVTTELPKKGNDMITLKDQSATGTIYFDNSAGRISHSTLVQNMTMGITLAGQTIDQKIKQTIGVRVTEAAN